ncbi:TPA: hypothetical protein ACLAOT_002003, partial [Neisseria meningitidis]
VRIPAFAGMTNWNGARTFAGIFCVSIPILFLMCYSKNMMPAGGIAPCETIKYPNRHSRESGSLET